MVTFVLWTGIALVVLGVGGVLSTTAATAAIPAVFGLALIVFASLARNPERRGVMLVIALGIAGLGALGALANIVRLAGAGTFGLNAATFSNVMLLLLSGTPLVLWIAERVMGRPLINE